jgi:hypothetical protein
MFDVLVFLDHSQSYRYVSRLGCKCEDHQHSREPHFGGILDERQQLVNAKSRCWAIEEYDSRVLTLGYAAWQHCPSFDHQFGANPQVGMTHKKLMEHVSTSL